MRKNLIFVVVAVAALVVYWGMQHHFSQSTADSSADASHHSAYERVLQTGVLRCSYGLWEPGVMRDPNTGELSGLIYDVMQEVGKSLNLKVEYVHEIDWASIADDLQSHKADAHCAGVWATPARGRRLAFTDPIAFLPVVAFVREGDHRFDNNVAAINSPDVTIAIIDDDVSEEIATQDFPLAKRAARPQIGAVEDLLTMVELNKADITFDGPHRFKPFDRQNPNKIRIVPTLKPIRIFPSVIAVDIHEHELQNMLNTAIHQMQDNGTFDRLRAKYDFDSLLPIVRPYDWKAWDSETNKGKN